MKTFQPLGDLILVRPLPWRDGLIEIPEIIEGKHSHQPGDYQDSFVGEVVAVGPGDRLLHARCVTCGAEKALLACRAGGHPPSWRSASFGACECGRRKWEFVTESRAPMECKVGDRVIYPRRPSAPGGGSDIEIDGERFLIFHEEQSAFAILET